MTRIGVLGANGRLGSVAVDAAERTDDLDVLVIDSRGDLRELAEVDVVFEATVFDASARIVRAAAGLGKHVVVGTSGWNDARVAELAAESVTGVRIVPNFSVGSVVGTRLAAIAASYFSDAEVIEMHHERKVDAPSGTAVRTAETIAKVRSQLAPYAEAPGRGALIDGVPVHAVRLPGITARQDVVFGGIGETLTIRHDTQSSAAYTAGILLALRAEPPRGVVVGIDDLLGL